MSSTDSSAHLDGSAVTELAVSPASIAESPLLTGNSKATSSASPTHNRDAIRIEPLLLPDVDSPSLAASSTDSTSTHSVYFLGNLSLPTLKFFNYFLPLWVLAFIGTVVCGLLRSTENTDVTFSSTGIAFGNFAFSVSYLPQACFHFATAICLRQLLSVKFGADDTREQCERIHAFSGDWSALDRTDLGLILVPAVGSVIYIIFQISNFLQSNGGALNALFFLSVAVHVSCMFQLGAFCLVAAKRILYMLRGVVEQIPSGVMERSRRATVASHRGHGADAPSERILFLFSGVEYDKIVIDAQTIFNNCRLFLNLGMWDVSCFWLVSVMSIIKSEPTALGFLRFMCFSWCLGTMMFFFAAANNNYHVQVEDVLRQCRLHTAQHARSAAAEQIGGGCLYAYQYMGMRPILVKIFSVPVNASLMRGYAIAALSTLVVAYRPTILGWINSGVF
jgi:hypothetical protein